ncbi:hypothetical protein ACQUSR_08910 [Streptomyces sp. P1-3]|uniref:hypothetical protein n=1 Tax=Streptomyces sp. P1-3 TaxID=3421658 RepID=UPI003D35E42B
MLHLELHKTREAELIREADRQRLVRRVRRAEREHAGLGRVSQRIARQAAERFGTAA